MKYLKITLLILLLWINTEAAGLFNLGLMAGVANDAGNVEEVTGDFNMEMRSVVGATVTELETTYTPVLSVNIAYINDNLLIKTGWEYTTNYFYNSSGSINSAGTANKIEIDYSRYTFPVTLGVVIPLTNRDRFYFAGGLNMSYVVMKVKQSNPGFWAAYPDKSHTFASYIMGTHIKCGAESIISRNYSIAFEFTRYYGNPKKVKSEDKGSETFLNVNSFEITAGINYNIDFKI